MGLARAAVAFALFVAFGSAAQASDGAALKVLGFSPDAKRFAFEQFGSQDGSGYPYSDLQVIDTTNGADIEGDLFRTLVETETGDVEIARKATNAKAKTVLDRLKISSRGMMLAVNPAIRPSEELLAMDVWPVLANEVSEMALPASRLGPGKIRIDQRPATSPYCSQIGEEAKAFTLSLVREGAAPLTLHADTDLPDSRVCSSTYGVAGVYLRAHPDGAFALVVIVSFYPRGFEGPDRRFLAFAARMPAR